MTTRTLKWLFGFLALAALTAPVAGEYRHTVNEHEILRQDSYLAQRRFSGRAVAAQRSALAFELPGRVERVSVEAGQTVLEGDTLVALDTSLLEAQKAEFSAALAENRAALTRVTKDLARQRDLQKKGYSATQVIDKLTAERDMLRAKDERLQAQLRGVDIRLAKSVLKAPFDGEILEKFVDPGVIVKEGQPALELAELGHTEAVVGIPRALRDSVEAGQTVLVRGDFGEARARVDSVSRVVDPGTLTHSVRVSFPGDTDVADGAIVYLLLEQREPVEGFWAPLSALLEGYRGTWAVLVLRSGKEAGTTVLEKHSVEPIYQQADRVFLAGSLQTGDRIVADGVHRYAAGQHVQVSTND